jgi:hypothetical protein
MSALPHLHDPPGSRRRRQLLGLLAAAVALRAAPAAADAGAQDGVAPPPEVAQHLPGATRVGEGRYTYFGFSVYEASLWSTAPVPAQRWWEADFALSLRYARSLRGAAIAERSIEEMRRQAEVSDAQQRAWLAWMSGAFPDVRAGDRITGLYHRPDRCEFFYQGRPTAGVSDAAFARLFFGIWLSPRTSAPGLRAALLGLPPGAA